ncbi:superoxide dismutase [candidate division KSB1 bacterium]|nr:superoxide dismutase [candidate division KSB1 bacterium]
MKIIAIEKELSGVTKEMFTPELLAAEARKVWELYQTGFIREIYFRMDQSSAVLILECLDREEARDILKRLPLFEVNLIDFEIIPLKPYPGLARLFKEA